MTRHDRTVWPLAAGLAAMAGYVDAIGFLKLAGLFVSFMSGNTTRLAVGIVTDPAVAATALCLIAAFVSGVMGATNTIFQRGGEVSIGVTYMTGTLVKLGQRLAGVLLGGPRWAWLPYLTLWTGLAGGAVAGTIAWSRLGTASIGAASAVAWLLAGYAMSLGAAEPLRFAQAGDTGTA